MQTVIGLNSPQAVKRWSAVMFSDVARSSYFTNKFAGKGQNATTPIQILTDLERDDGDTIKFDLLAQLEQEPIYGDATQEGTEEKLRYFQDEVKIEQVRCGVNAGGRMTRKRTLHDIRSQARTKMSEWWARWGDEILFMYAAGARGVNKYLQKSLTYNGFGGNAFQAPDATHRMYGGDATSFNTIASDDKMSLGLIDRLVTRAETMGGEEAGIPELQPMKVDGEDRYVLVMHKFQEHDLRTSAGVGQWLDIQKAAAGAEGQKSPIFRGSLGMYRGAVLHSHKSVVRFNNAGADGLQPAARAMFLGRQGIVMAYGSPGSGLRYDWHEETRDNGNQVVISSSTIVGAKATVFNGQRFGMLTADTYAADPG
jgi:N4-gp56 family major capsid protein